MKARPGDVFFVDLGTVAKPRFILIIGADDNSPLALVSGLVITTQYHGSKYEVTLPRVPWLREQSYVNAQSVQPFKTIELGRHPGRFEASVLNQCRQALKHWFEA